MAKKIYMTNLKGGAGVTTCCVQLGLALANAGERTLILDGDRYAASALVISGCANMQFYTVNDFASGACRAKQTLISHPATCNLSLSSCLGLNDGQAAERAVEELDGLFDYILLDKAAPAKCDCAVIVTEPYLSSVKSADCCKARLCDSGVKDVGVIVNKLNGGQILSGDVMTAQEIATLLRLPLKGVIPEDFGLPLGRRRASTAKAFKVTADNISGKKNAVYNVLPSYFGLNGYIKRKVRERL